ncbi:hypothetical protein HPP92_016954 [Vanilla planifolia]|uniref:Uncharacterized protein n=1 Tax=Vanilla planifolia TaxID=51239 RepID=A0A835QJ23_VANPL|nr:hypothetical protein HPP92_016954 [Vanilla planifolia]
MAEGKKEEEVEKLVAAQPLREAGYRLPPFRRCPRHLHHSTAAEHHCLVSVSGNIHSMADGINVE